jgi:cyclase
MFRPRVIPCLLLKDKGLVKTVNFENPRYIGDPINAVRIFNDKEADELLFLDIAASRRTGLLKMLGSGGDIPIELIAKISRECLMPLSYGGGIKTIEDIRVLFHAGVEKVALNTHAVSNIELVREASETFGSQSIIVSIDARRHPDGAYEVYTNGGKTATGLEPAAFAKRMETAGAGEIMITSIDRDGSFQGYDLTLTRRVAEAVDIPVVASGGAGRLDDFLSGYCDGHASALAAGSLFVYHGRKRAVLINYPTRTELEHIFQGVSGLS